MTGPGPKAHLWLRDETKPFERRTALTPNHALKLIEAGLTVSVERSVVRCFADEEYSAVGATMEPSGTWSKAPEHCIILGIKELPDQDTPLIHKHLFFAHAYKGQQGWQTTINRFKQGGGVLLDLEFLVDEAGRRVAAFGRWAGFAGAALAVDIWAHQQIHGDVPVPEVKMVRDEAELLDGLRARLSAAVQRSAAFPRAMIIGAKGRCGSGAIDLFQKLSFPTSNLSLWDLSETASGGPFSEILDHELFINCVLVQGKMNPFLTREMLDQPRKLCVISDVSCDPKSPNNPIPVYDSVTTFSNPVIRLESSQRLDLTAIDHLPSLLPRESSQDFGGQMLPYLLTLGSDDPVWIRAYQLYRSFEAKT
jgi:saccharopine dehydrogenase (NAD+, L-lysine-forming)